MKTALITGLTGQDGALLARLLLEKDYRVVGMVRRTSSPTDWRLKELGLLQDPNLVLCSGDLTDQGSIERIVKEYQPNEVYNLAAQSFVGSSWDSPESTCDITGLGALRVFDAVRNSAGSARVYQASSSEMFGGANRTETLTEESSFEPQSPYGAAKVFAHHMAEVYRRSFSLHVSCGILFNHESEWRGEQFVTRKVTKAAAAILLGLQDRLSLHNLDSFRDWGYAGDYVEAMWLMLQQDEPDDYVIATGCSHNIGDLCEVAFKSVGIADWESRIDLSGGRPADVRHLRGVALKANRKLGWEPKVGFESMVQRMVHADVERLKEASRE